MTKNNPYSKCTNKECGIVYYGWAEQLMCGECGHFLTEYKPSLEEIKAENEKAKKEAEAWCAENLDGILAGIKKEAFKRLLKENRFGAFN